MIKPNVGMGAVKLVLQIYCHHPFREWWGTVYFKENSMFIFSDLEGVFFYEFCLNKIIQEKVKVEHCGFIPSKNKNNFKKVKAKCPVVEKLLSELWYLEYYAAIKNHDYVAYVVKW